MTAAPSPSAGLPARLEHVVARNAAQLRRDRGWTQLDLAREMADVGLGWTPGRAQQVESLAGTLTLPEVLGLCWVLRVPIADLLDGDDHVGAARLRPDLPATPVPRRTDRPRCDPSTRPPRRECCCC